MIGWAKQIPDFDFEVEFVVILIKKLGIQTHKVIEKGFLSEQRLHLIFERRLYDLHNCITICEIILFLSWTQIFFRSKHGKNPGLFFASTFLLFPQPSIFFISDVSAIEQVYFIEPDFDEMVQLLHIIILLIKKYSPATIQKSNIY